MRKGPDVFISGNSSFISHFFWRLEWHKPIEYECSGLVDELQIPQIHNTKHPNLSLTTKEISHKLAALTCANVSICFRRCSSRNPFKVNGVLVVPRLLLCVWNRTLSSPVNHNVIIITISNTDKANQLFYKGFIFINKKWIVTLTFFLSAVCILLVLNSQVL